MLEYRDKTERFEAILPGKGLLVYRIDDRYTGCSSNHDEVYLFRPNASDATINGTLSQAFFSGSTSRTSFTPQTDPLTVVRRNGGLEIIGVAGKAMAIYDIIGRCHWQGVGKEQLFIPISRPGVYLLHIEGMKVFRFSVL